MNGPPLPQLVHIRDLVYQVAGIFQPDNKMTLLEDHCAKRMQAVGAPTLREYYECLTSRSMQQTEMTSLLSEITVGETCFFRNQPQLDALRNVVLPKIVDARDKLAVPHLRLWSAGCSTGEEPYTLSMLLLEETAAKLQGWTFEILATDLSEKSIAHCMRGVYSDYSTRNLTPYFREKYFTIHAAGLQVNSEARQPVTFVRANLLADEPANASGIDIILCCNVLMYFDVASRQQVLQRFHNDLLPHGYFFLGHAESLYGMTEDFRLVHLPSATGYVRSEKKNG